MTMIGEGASTTRMGREALKKKREAQPGSKMPFVVTPIATPVNATTPHVFEEEPPDEVVAERAKTVSWTWASKLSDVGYGVLCSFASIAIGLALTTLVDGLRDSILRPHRPPSNTQHQNKPSANEHVFSDRDIIYSSL